MARGRPRVDLASSPGQPGVDPESTRSSPRVDLVFLFGDTAKGARAADGFDPGSTWGRSRVVPTSTRGQSGVDPVSIEGPYGVDPVPIRD